MYTDEFPQKIKTVAFYRLLYGADFLKESLDSIYQHVDKILFFCTNKVWKGIESVTYFGKQVYIPHAIDNSLDIIENYVKNHDPDRKIVMLTDYFDSPANQITHLINTKIMVNYNPEFVLYVEPDEIYSRKNIEKLLEKPRQHPRSYGFAIYRKEYWKSWKYHYLYKSNRQRLYVMNNTTEGGKVHRRKIQQSNCGGNEISNIISCNDLWVDHLCYASSPKTIFWKHICGLGFSPGIDSMPREDWFEEIWMKWDYKTNRIKGLCPAQEAPHAIPDVELTEFEDLPEVLQERYSDDRN